MKTRRFDFNFRPLQVDFSFVVVGSVPPKQNYNADTNEYTPDYTLVPLTIQPRVGVVDKDGVIASGSVNAKLTNIRWREIVGGETKTIESSNTSYVVTLSGDNAGRIVVKKNAAPSNPITLEFSAEYIDTRTSQIYTVLRTFLIKCDNATSVQPRVVLDAAEQTLYNPLKDVDDQVVTARLLLGEEVVDVDTREFVWEKCRGGQWTVIGSDGVLDGNNYTENLLLGSGTKVENSKYPIASYYLVGAPEDYVDGEEYTITIWGELGEGKIYFDIYNSGGTLMLTSLSKKSDGVYTRTFKWASSFTTSSGSTYYAQNTNINIYPFQYSVLATSRIDCIKLERGENKNPVWTPAKQEQLDDYDVTISDDTATATIHRKLMGERIDIRCKAKYNKNGEYKDVELTDASPSALISVIRRIPKFEFDIQGIPTNIPPGSQTIAPVAVVRDTNGDLNDYEKELLPLWYMATNKASGELSYQQVAHGKEPILPTKLMSQNYGAVVGLEVVDLGPLCKMADSNGNIFVDKDRALILIK